MRIEGIDSAALNAWLWTKHRIFTVTIKHPEFEGLRIMPNVYTTLDELGRFVEAMESVLREGLPSA